MDSTVDLAVERTRDGRTRVSRLGHCGALAARITGAEQGGVTIHLVGAAAGPLVGDSVRVTVDVGAGTLLQLRSVAATIALAAYDRDPRQPPARVELAVSVGDGATFDLDLQPTIVTALGDVDLVTTVAAHAGAALRLNEQILSGRHGEPGGRWSATLDLVVGGTAVLRQRSTQATSPARAVINQVSIGDWSAAGSAPGSAGDPWCGAAWCDLAAGGRTASAWGPDLGAARRIMRRDV